eukprot:gnl/TRDRNA2_/TRDRNA2_184895_c0_seq1.p1 gnl/TRDRNA2_/TRDRNA2_184895_c0~~gnl/TRDRNA2_/TRDRNA2_184895_c0_seq1.p1  ORF type:complete len:460 (+),score=34.44 gnl/TRDRNA2_/TRDRNA2_184895_c0_seq1:201-1382(+)
MPTREDSCASQPRAMVSATPRPMSPRPALMSHRAVTPHLATTRSIPSLSTHGNPPTATVARATSPRPGGLAAQAIPIATAMPSTQVARGLTPRTSRPQLLGLGQESWMPPRARLGHSASLPQGATVATAAVKAAPGYGSHVPRSLQGESPCSVPGTSPRGRSRASATPDVQDVVRKLAMSVMSEPCLAKMPCTSARSTAVPDEGESGSTLAENCADMYDSQIWSALDSEAPSARGLSSLKAPLLERRLMPMSSRGLQRQAPVAGNGKDSITAQLERLRAKVDSVVEESKKLKSVGEPRLTATSPAAGQCTTYGPPEREATAPLPGTSQFASCPVRTSSRAGERSASPRSTADGPTAARPGSPISRPTRSPPPHERALPSHSRVVPIHERALPL